MMKCVLLLTLALTASSAWATGTPASVPTSSTSRAEADSLATSSARSEATSTASQIQTASGTASQSQTAQGGSSQAVNSGNNAAQSVSVDATRRAAASAYAPTVYASSVCAVGWSAGLQFPGVGGSGGKSRTDKGCELRENIRIVASLNPALALKAACLLEGIKDVATEADCLYMSPEPVKETAKSEHAAVDLSGYATRQELEQAFKRSVSK